MIEIEKLEDGKAYMGHGRNFKVAIWDGHKFWGLRYKFGDKFMDDELHKSSDEHHGTFTPDKELT